MERFDRLHSPLTIRNRILFFALLITLIPFLGMGWLLNEVMQSTITENSEQKLQHISSTIEREINLWLKERSYDLHVFSNSFVINENYERYRSAGISTDAESEEKPVFIKTLETYLTTVKNQFEYYSRLAILDKNGSLVATSQPFSNDDRIKLPENFQSQIEKKKYFNSEIFFSKHDNSPQVLIGTPLFSNYYETYVGILVIECSLHSVLEIMQSSLTGFLSDTGLYVSLLSMKDGRIFLSTDEKVHVDGGQYSVGKILHRFDKNYTLQDFTDYMGNRVVGVLKPMNQLSWGVIVAESYDDVFAKVSSSRNRNLIIVCLLGLLIGFLAYLLARQIIVPLRSLTKGAQEVAEGNLDVSLPVLKNDELGVATGVFNEMVSELKQNQEKLELLATTDSLTGLSNRKYVLGSLLTLFKHFKRYNTEFSILMIDIDHFKDINDTYGHQVGDLVLSAIGEIFIKSLRSIDTAGRYGGEEFLILLPESDEDDAIQTAERIRREVESAPIQVEDCSINVTVSIGIGTVSREDVSENYVVKRADEALYEAKGGGRNRYVYLPVDETEEKLNNIILLKAAAE